MRYLAGLWVFAASGLFAWQVHGPLAGAAVTVAHGIANGAGQWGLIGIGAALPWLTAWRWTLFMIVMAGIALSGAETVRL